MQTEIRSWAVDGPITSPFARPSGLLGRLAGRFMLWKNKHDDVVGVLDVQPGDRVVEVGFGPGNLIRLLVQHTEAATIIGVDPSPAMHDLAGRVNRAALRSGRVQLVAGTADRTGLPDASVDRIVSVNNVAIWSDLEAGITELHRVVRPGGTVVIAWHGGASPDRLARRLRLQEDKLRRIEEAVRQRFSEVARRQLATQDVFIATR